MSQSEGRARRRAERREARNVINQRVRGLALVDKVAYLELVADGVDGDRRRVERAVEVHRVVSDPPEAA